MAADDLTRPLGLARPKAPGARFRRFGLAAAGLAFVAAAAAWFLLVRDPEAEGPDVVATIDGADAPSANGTSTSGGTSARISSPPEGQAGLTEIVPDGAISEVGADTVIIGEPGENGTLRLASAPMEELAEDGPYGLLPRIAPDGLRPMDAYARPLDAQAGESSRRIAIVVGGIGIAEDGSDAAVEELPGAVTLAFAPYGKNLEEMLARARSAGHEILLQLPLEPYGYPGNDPGPHTLTVGASAEENIDRLHWLMSRITTYVGVTNYLGARFTSEEAALAPLLDEIGGRGLLYLDDGSSGMSKADRMAKGKAPFARADVILDAVTEAAAIDARLAQVEAIARQRGYAIATATAFPVTVERIAAFVKAAAERGFEIVPLTALVANDRT
jgi:polysaccharide deacetylase 2 family uncharacterized protein YibQ